MSIHRKIARSAGVIGFLTGISRILGFVRDLVIASAFGTGVGAEAFVVSFRIPNLLRDLVGEGAANAAVVPVLTERHKTRPAGYWRLVSTLIAASGALLVFLSIMGVVFSPALVKAMAPGFVASSDPEKLPLTVHLTRVIFPYIFLIGLSALFMGVLNSLEEFKSSALGPILLNICMIVAGIFLEKRFGPLALVLGVLAGGVLQLACQIPPLYAKGFRWERPDFSDDAVKKIAKLLLPRALGSALYQANVFVDSILASFERFVGAGGQSALYYSNRLFQLPLAIFGLSLAQALLPTFSAQMVQKDWRTFKETFDVSVRSLAFVIVPASVGLLVLAEPIIRIIFERGRFDAYSTAITSSALFFYSFGLFSCCLIKILSNVFYAMHDTRTPLKAMLIAVVLNVVLCLVLMRPLKIGGLTLASSISATVNASILYVLLRRRVGSLGGRRLAASFLKILAAAAAMGAVAYFLNQTALLPRAGAGRLEQSLWLVGTILLSIASYFLFAFLLRLSQMRKLLRWQDSSPTI